MKDIPLRHANTIRIFLVFVIPSYMWAVLPVSGIDITEDGEIARSATHHDYQLRSEVCAIAYAEIVSAI